ncbi:MAG TPA: phosphate ABC transporter substrate-binding protein PstS [Acidimicrobiales bacterium]|nr:phosphate ABC transporter substrate-binding protein PstS [Acidimicrobiales bacterium]
MPLRRRLPALVLVAVVAVGAAACSSSSSSSSASTASAASTAGASSAPGGTLGGTADTTTPAASLTGAGASSAQPFLTRAFYDYNRTNPKLTVNYSAAGSAVGISDIQAGTVTFGQSEIPMSASDQAKATGGPILQVPIDLGGVAISYNVPGAPTNLQLDGNQLADIYLGTVTDWHQIDSSIPAGTTIVPVHRADSSGPGYDLDQYLIDTSPAWVTAIGTTTASKTWPKANVGVGQQLNSGVATYVKQTPGAIGFVEYAYALQNGFTNAALRNTSGSYVAPSIASIAAAGSHATDLSSANFNIVDAPGNATYPLANFSWSLIYQKQKSTDTGIALGKLLDWIATTGQRNAQPLGYAPMPANAQAVAHTALLQLQGADGSALFAS